MLFLFYLTFYEFVCYAAVVIGFPNAAYFEHDLLHVRGLRSCIVSDMIIHVRFDVPAVQLVAQRMHASARASHDRLRVFADNAALNVVQLRDNGFIGGQAGVKSHEHFIVMGIVLCSH
jgi:hypothetical protein